MESFNLDHVQARKVQKLLEDEGEFRLRVLFELGSDAQGLPADRIYSLALNEIAFEHRKKNHQLFRSGRLTGLIQVAAAAKARLWPAVNKEACHASL